MPPPVRVYRVEAFFLCTTMKINRVNYPNQFFLDFDEENQFIVNINGYKPLYHLSDLIRLRDMVEKSIETYISKEISDEIVDSNNEEHIEEYLKSWKIEKDSEPIEVAQGFLYLFLDREYNRLKIGRSKNPSKRIKQIESNMMINLESLFELNNMGNLEQEVLILFNKYNIRGEWFSYQQDIVDYFATLKSNQENGI